MSPEPVPGEGEGEGRRCGGRDGFAFPRGGGVYVLVTESLCAQPFRRVVAECVRAGASAIQLREKDLSDEDLARRVGELRELTAPAGVALIVNDRPAVALASDADGVHVGAEDEDPVSARRRLGPGRLVGVTCHSVDEAVRAAEAGADYLGVGPMFPSGTKSVGPPQGPAFLRSMRDRVDLPIFAIGGIDPDNSRAVMRAGATGVAVCQAVVGSDDPYGAVRRLRAAVEGEARP